MTVLSPTIQTLGVRNSMFFFGKKRQAEVDKALQKLDERHTRQIAKIDKTTQLVDSVNKALISGVKVRHITEAIAAATGRIK